jgi:DNA-binding transcriptional LysR family regulator
MAKTSRKQSATPATRRYCSGDDATRCFHQGAGRIATLRCACAHTTRLFDRVGKRLILNDSARLLLPQAKQMPDAANTIEQQFSVAHASSAGLHVGASTTIGIYLLPAILAASSTPGGDAHHRVLIANTADIAAAVADFAIDAGLIEGPCHESGLQVEPWIADELIISGRRAWSRVPVTLRGRRSACGRPAG